MPVLTYPPYSLTTILYSSLSITLSPSFFSPLSHCLLLLLFLVLSLFFFSLSQSLSLLLYLVLSYLEQFVEPSHSLKIVFNKGPRWNFFKQTPDSLLVNARKSKHCLCLYKKRQSKDGVNGYETHKNTHTYTETSNNNSPMK